MCENPNNDQPSDFGPVAEFLKLLNEQPSDFGPVAEFLKLLGEKAREDTERADELIKEQGIDRGKLLAERTLTDEEQTNIKKLLLDGMAALAHLINMETDIIQVNEMLGEEVPDDKWQPPPFEGHVTNFV